MVNIEITITIENVKDLDQATQDFIKTLAKNSNMVKLVSASSQSSKNVTFRKGKTPLRDLSEYGMPSLTINCLERIKIYFVEDITRLTLDNLLGMRNFGPGRLKELFAVLKRWQEENPNESIRKWLDRYTPKVNFL